jgi:RNA polymerase sigma-70 factor (ECF subfamily)
MSQEIALTEFEQHRGHLRAVAYRMVGSISEADDAVPATWQRYERADTSEVENLRGWLTTVVSRVCLNLLRSRAAKREVSLELHVPDPIVSRATGVDPEHEAIVADSIGLALLVVLDTLGPAERLAFVLHDLFSVPFDEIAPIVGREPAAARQLASRARRRVQGANVIPDPDLGRQRAAVDAFFAASRNGDFDALVAILDPVVVVRSDLTGLQPAHAIRGAEAVASSALTYSQLAPFVRPALINGVAGVVVAPEGRPVSIMAFTVIDGRVAQIDALVDPDRLARVDLSALDR